MNKFLLITIIYFSQIFNNVLGSELKPLSEILKSDTSEQTVLYSLLRCSALHHSSSNKVLNSTETNKQKVYEDGKKNAGLFALSAFTMNKQRKLQMSSKQIENNIINIYDAYIKKWKINYANTGNEYGEMTLEDLKVCKSILTSIITK
jgi:hypothetical protein